jgi:hypothetical protein
MATFVAMTNRVVRQININGRWYNAASNTAFQASAKRGVSGQREIALMPEMPHAGEYHRQPGRIRRDDHLGIAD